MTYPENAMTNAPGTSPTPPAARKHAGMGIAATILGVLAIITDVAIFVGIRYVVLASPEDFDQVGTGQPVDPNELPVVLVAAGLGLCLSMMLNLLGLGFVLGGFLQKDRKRLFAWIGLFLNLAPLLLFVIRLIYVFATGQANLDDIQVQ